MDRDLKVEQEADALELWSSTYEKLFESLKDPGRSKALADMVEAHHRERWAKHAELVAKIESGE